MIEKLIKQIANTQIFEPDDKLTRLLELYVSYELDEESLDLVVAASQSDYQKFLNRVNSRRSL